MKILYFIESLCAGGKERRLLELIKYLSLQQNYNLMLVMMSDTVHYQEIYKLNVEIKIIKRKHINKDPRVFFLFYRLCKEYRPDVIHVWGNMPAFYAVPASILLRIPFINSQITDAIETPLGFEYFTKTINFAFSDLILSNSRAGIISNKLEERKTRVIHNGVFLNRFNGPFDSEQTKKSLGIRSQYSIIMVGSFTRLKNHDLFLDVAKYYLDKNHAVSFVAVGDGENINRIKQRINSEGINNVTLTGRIDNVEAVISACDIGILLSPFGEGMSNAIIEYMALRKPVIASNKGGNRELVRDGHSGFLLKSDTVQNVARFIDQLLADDNLRAQMGNNGRQMIEGTFTIDKMMKDFEAIYSVYRNEQHKIARLS